MNSDRSESSETEKTELIEALPEVGIGNAEEASNYEFLAPAEQPGELGRLAEFRVLRLLGEGGMGIVFLAEDTRLGRKVALKVMKPQFTDQVGFRTRFLREAKAMAQLRNDHIVVIHHVGEDRKVMYLVMEWLDGETLEARLKRNELFTFEAIIRIGREVADGLHAAHQQGMIHRDIKPANIFLERGRDRVKLLDFGLVRAITDDAQLTQTGMIVGTPAYVAPEIALGEPGDARSDLFSLGCVLYRLCCGDLPFPGKTSFAVMTAITTTAPKPIAQVNPQIPDSLAYLVMRLLEKDPAQRPATATAVADRFRAMEPTILVERASLVYSLHQREEPPLSTHIPEPTSEQTEAIPRLRPQPEPTRKQSKPSMYRPLWIGVTAAIVVALCIGGWLVVRMLTAEGTVELAAKSPAITIMLEGEQSVRLDPAVGRSVQLRPGKYRARLADDDKRYEVLPTEFTLERDGTVTLTVRALGVVELPQPAMHPPNEITNSVEMKFTRIPAGKFMMGTNGSAKSEFPQHPVEISKAFFFGIYEVTQGQYEKVIGQNPSEHRGDLNLPVEMVSWFDAEQFCQRLTANAEEMKAGRRYRLPTEAEWEYACRAGGFTSYPCGSDVRELLNYAWVIENAEKKSHPVGGRKANAWGLYDMAGNVFEWCADIYQEDYYRSSPRVDPKGPKNPPIKDHKRVMRGGSWFTVSESARSAARAGYAPSLRSNSVGFRVVMEVSE